MLKNWHHAYEKNTVRVLTKKYNNVLSALTLSQPSWKRREHHSDRVWFLVPHAREKVEYLKTVDAYDQAPKKKKRSEFS